MPGTPCSRPTLMAAPTKAKLVPITHGRRMPTGPTPMHWMVVTMPEPSSAALTNATTCSAGSFRTAPTTSGTAMMPPRAASMCWAASRAVVMGGGRSLTWYSSVFILSPLFLDGVRPGGPDPGFLDAWFENR